MGGALVVEQHVSAEKPWERKGTSTVIADAIEEQTHEPWNPKPAAVPKQIQKAHRAKKSAENKGRAKPVTIFRRQEFAKSYLIDCNPAMAALRCGMADNIDDARRVGYQLYHEPLTLAAIQAFSARLETDKVVSRERVIMGLLEEANYHGLGASHSGRVAAWAKLAAMIGAEKPKAEEDPNAKVRGGVMLLPMAASIEEWESAATGSQAALKAAVRQ